MNCCYMAAVIEQHAAILASILDFQKKNFFRFAANFLTINEKTHVFITSNLKNNTFKKKIKKENKKVFIRICRFLIQILTFKINF